MTAGLFLFFSRSRSGQFHRLLFERGHGGYQAMCLEEIGKAQATGAIQCRSASESQSNSTSP